MTVLMVFTPIGNVNPVMWDFHSKALPCIVFCVANVLVPLTYKFYVTFHIFFVKLDIVMLNRN